MTLQECITHLETIAPPILAEAWDNTGLLLGERAQSIRRVMTCLTLTPDVAREAIQEQVDLIVSHHPILFRAIQRLTDDTVEGGMLLDLVRAHVSVYSPHTAYDSAKHGINQQIALGLGLEDIQPLRPREPLAAADAGDADPAIVGAGRFGRLPTALRLGVLVDQLREQLQARGVQYVGDPDRSIRKVAVACGAAAEFLADAIKVGCDVLVTGEARFHACLEARSSGIALVLPGHYATERPAVEALATRIASEWSGVVAWASRQERDPLTWNWS